jgi:hypothetical protein
MSDQTTIEEPADPNARRPLSPTVRLLVIIGELLFSALFLPIIALFPRAFVEREPGPFVVIGVGCIASAYGLWRRRRWMMIASLVMVLISGYALLRAFEAGGNSPGWGVVMLIPLPLNGIAIVYCLVLFGLQLGSATVAFNSVATKGNPEAFPWLTELLEAALVLILIPLSVVFDFSAPASFQEEWRANRDAALAQELERREADRAEFERKNQQEIAFLNEWARARKSGNERLYEGLTAVLIQRMTDGPLFPPNIETFVLQTDSDSRGAILDLTLTLPGKNKGLSIWVADAILDSGESGPLRRKAVETLLRNGYSERTYERDVSAAPAFREILEEPPQSSDPLVRLRTIEALRDLGTEAEHFVPVIDRVAASDPNPTIREAAKEAAALIRASVRREESWAPSLRSRRLPWEPPSR